MTEKICLPLLQINRVKTITQRALTVENLEIPFWVQFTLFNKGAPCFKRQGKTKTMLQYSGK